MKKRRIVVGVSGASGVALAFQLLEELRLQVNCEVHLVTSSSSERTIDMESDRSIFELQCLADVVHDSDNLGASISSGTFKTEGMVIIPCSMKTLAGIAHGYSDNLLLRAADVTMKERRPLIIIARETPLSRIHLNNMATLAEYGAVIMPPMMTHYNRPQTIADMEQHIVGKILHEFGMEASHFKRWGEQE